MIFWRCLFKDLYSAEEQITQALPEMIEKASSQELKDAFSQHLEETKEQMKRLEECAQQYDFTVSGHICVGMQGIIQENEETLELAAEAEPDLVDVVLIAGAQKVDHYEIAGYGTILALCNMLGYEDTADKLSETLEEEKATDEKLSELAMSKENMEAE